MTPIFLICLGSFALIALIGILVMERGMRHAPPAQDGEVSSWE